MADSVGKSVRSKGKRRKHQKKTMRRRGSKLGREKTAGSAVPRLTYSKERSGMGQKEDNLARITGMWQLRENEGHLANREVVPPNRAVIKN
jgi:hypothetical protein